MRYALLMQRNGFSLVELSIVLVIIGLLVGGVMAGQALVRASHLRAVPTEFSRYLTALHGFQEKYYQYPGDFSGATRFWGHQVVGNNCTNRTGAAVNATTGVCDGDGDNIVDHMGASGAGEGFQAWRHLAAAGMVEGTYSGIAHENSTIGATYGVNVPSSRLTKASWTLWDLYMNSSVAFNYDFGNALTLSQPQPTTWPTGGILKVEEAYSIDKKMDDGHAARGKVWAIRWNTCTSATTNTDYQDYQFTNTASDVCALAFGHVF